MSYDAMYKVLVRVEKLFFFLSKILIIKARFFEKSQKPCHIGFLCLSRICVVGLLNVPFVRV